MRWSKSLYVNSPGAILSIYTPICSDRIKSRSSLSFRTTKFTSIPKVTRSCVAISRNSCRTSFRRALPLSSVRSSPFTVHGLPFTVGVRPFGRIRQTSVSRCVVYPYVCMAYKMLFPKCHETENSKRRTTKLSCDPGIVYAS